MNGEVLPLRMRMGDRIPKPTRYYWQERGWKRDGHVLTGEYRTDYGNVLGTISFEPTVGFRFYVHNPPKELRIHPYWPDFTLVGGDLYLLHFATDPKDIDSGIVAIEKLLNEVLSVRTDSDPSTHIGRLL